jgi:ASC-1-like (ASCH) protein
MGKDYIEFYQVLLQLNMNIKETKKSIIQAGHIAVEELIKVAKEAIVDSGDDITADRLKNAAATKKLAIFDAFEILNRIQEEENLLNGKEPEDKKERVFKGFAEGRSKK